MSAGLARKCERWTDGLENGSAIDILMYRVMFGDKIAVAKMDTKLKGLVTKSKASDEFKRAVLEFAEGTRSDLIRYSPGSPPIKVLRVLMKLLDEYPNEQITEVDIRGSSSCSTYTGTLTFAPPNKRIAFSWNCEWKARQEGFKTWYGAPDQVKAAHLFGYQCFEKFEAV